MKHKIEYTSFNLPRGKHFSLNNEGAFKNVKYIKKFFFFNCNVQMKIMILYIFEKKL